MIATMKPSAKVIPSSTSPWRFTTSGKSPEAACSGGWWARAVKGGGLALAEKLRLNNTLTSLNLSVNHLDEDGGRALAETLRVNTALTSLDLSLNDLGEGGGQALWVQMSCNSALWVSAELQTSGPRTPRMWHWHRLTSVRLVWHTSVTLVGPGWFSLRFAWHPGAAFSRPSSHCHGRVDA